MAKQDFVKNWRVSWSQVSDVQVNDTFTINNGTLDAVEIVYHWPAYPSSQPGTYYTSGEDEWIEATFSGPPQRIIKFRFQQTNNMPDHDRICVDVSSVDPSGTIVVPEVGEWGAEADPG